MNKKVKVGVVVLGDIERSPRMRYHVYSLQREGYNVKFLGYTESKVSNVDVDNNVIVNLLQPPDFKKYLPILPSLILKTLWQALNLLWTLVLSGRYDILLVQNPPAVPTLAVCWFYCTVFRSKMIIDWHNYAYTILALTLGQGHKLVSISKKYEQFLGKLSDSNICVTNAMKEDLSQNWNIRAETLYDRPGPLFKPDVTVEERRHLFIKLRDIDEKFAQFIDSKEAGLLVSSTSWTIDEDFSILLNALKEYDGSDVNTRLVCVITGKGPMKEYYLNEISAMNWKKVDIITPWLDFEDYSRLLACADLGVCLHTSSSGFDLPMKVVDMFGAGLPVCALKYKCLEELIKDGQNGLLFENSSQLASQLISWFGTFPVLYEYQLRLRAETRKCCETDWHTNWKKVEHIFRL